MLVGRRHMFPVLLFFVSVGAAGCDFESPLSPPPSSTATVVQLYVFCGNWTAAGSTCGADAGYSDDGHLRVTAQASWESSDTTVATVDASGRVTFVGKGEVTIRASYQGFTASTKLSTIHSGPA